MRTVLTVFFVVLLGICPKDLFAQKSEIETSIFPPEESFVSDFHKKIFGTQYKRVYTTPVSIQQVQLDTLFGGVEITTEDYTFSYELIDKNGKRYSLSALDRKSTQLLPIEEYQERYKFETEDTFLSDVVNDIHKTRHPYVSRVLPTLSKAVQLYSSEPIILYIPQQKVLESNNKQLGNKSYEIAPIVDSAPIDLSCFGQPDRMLTTALMLDDLYHNPTHQLSESDYIRARLFDIIIGNWDSGIYSWAGFKQGNKWVYKPIAQSREQAFSSYDGWVMWVLNKTIPELQLMQRYTYNIPSLKKFLTTDLAWDTKIINTASIGDFYKEAQFIQAHLTDAVIEEAFDHFPTAIRDEKLERVKTVLKYRRDNLINIAKDYHDLIYKNVVISATAKDDIITIERLDGGVTNVIMEAEGEVYFEGTYYKENTKEIWIYACEGEDKIELKGQAKNYIKIKVIGGEGDDSYSISNPKKVKLYDYSNANDQFTNAADTKTILTQDFETHRYDDYTKRPKVYNKLAPVIGSNPDDGFFVGIKDVLTFENLRKNPFTHRHQLNASYYLRTSGFDIYYKGTHTALLDNYNTFVEAQVTSPNYANNFFGYGNEQKKGAFILDYYRYKLSTVYTALGLSQSITKKGEASLKLLFQSKEMEQTPNRFISSQPARTFNRNNFIGVEGTFTYDNFDKGVFPTKGFGIIWKNGIQTNLGNLNRSYFFTVPSISFTQYLIPSRKLVLASKFKSQLIIGNENNLEIYQMATIGGNEGLRGFNNQRFTGKSSIYLSNDIRYDYKNIPSRIIPLRLGFFGGFDAGRVFTSVSSDKIHTSIGVGAFIKAAELITGQTGLFFSSDGPRFTFGLGFKI